MIPGELPSFPGYAVGEVAWYYTVYTCARIYGNQSVNVSVSGLSHMAKSNAEAVYEYSKRKN